MSRISIKLLKSMGYRELDPDGLIYGKPIGHSLFVVDRQKEQWQQFFNGANGKTLVWSTQELPSELWTEDEAGDVEEWLKSVEAEHSKPELSVRVTPKFNFLTREEEAELVWGL